MEGTYLGHSLAPLVKKEQEEGRCLEWPKQKGNEGEKGDGTRVRSSTMTHDAPFRTNKTLTEAPDALFYVTIVYTTFPLPYVT
jgi:hypothetical protein